MKVSLITQKTNINNTHKLQILSATAPMKIDSVSFCGRKTNLAEEVVALAQKGMVIFWDESTYGKSVMDIKDSASSDKSTRFMFREYEKAKYLFSSEKVTKYSIRKGLHKGIEEQKLSKDEFSGLINQVRTIVTPKILKQHDLEQANTADLLRDLAIGLIDGSVKSNNMIFQFKDKICAIHMDHRSNLLMLSGSSIDASLHSFIKLEGAKELKLANKVNVIANYLLGKSLMASRKEVALNAFNVASKDFAYAKNQLDRLEAKQQKGIAEIDKRMALLLSKLKK